MNFTPISKMSNIRIHLCIMYLLYTVTRQFYRNCVHVCASGVHTSVCVYVRVCVGVAPQMYTYRSSVGDTLLG